MKQWLQVVRQAIILMDPTNLVDDAFSTSKALQKWIGISYHIGNHEGTPILHQDIQQELEAPGLQRLPQCYDKYWTITIEEMKKRPLQFQQ